MDLSGAGSRCVLVGQQKVQSGEPELRRTALWLQAVIKIWGLVLGSSKLRLRSSNKTAQLVSLSSLHSKGTWSLNFWSITLPLWFLSCFLKAAGHIFPAPLNLEYWYSNYRVVCLLASAPRLVVESTFVGYCLTHLHKSFRLGNWQCQRKATDHSLRRE